MFEKRNQDTTIKTNSTEIIPSTSSNKVVGNISNWYSDKYNSTLIQRNILLLIAICSVVVIIISVFAVGNIASNYKIQPFVIDIENKTGLTTIVNPITSQDLTANEALNKYFLMTYVRARESYNINNWQYQYLTVVRLLSSPNVYSEFRRFLNSTSSPMAVYGNQVSTSVAFRSIQLFPPVYDDKGVPGDSRAVIRYTIFPSNGGTLAGTSGNRIHKIVTMTYRYNQTEMNDSEREINPIGFFVTSFVANNENDIVN